MYTFIAINRRVDKDYKYYLKVRQDVRDKLKRIAEDPRNACGAHKLHGHLDGKWSCWLGSNIRMIYEIDDERKAIFIAKIGQHTIYG